MFIKLEILKHCSLLLLVICLCLANFTLSKKAPDDITKDIEISPNSTTDKIGGYQSIVYYERKKFSNKFQNIVENIIFEKKTQCLRRNSDFQLTKSESSNPGENLSLQGKDAEIFAGMLNEDTTVPVVTAFNTESSLSSSQFDNVNDIGRSFSDGVQSTSESDLNGTLIHTFQTEPDDILPGKFIQREQNEFKNDISKEEDIRISNETVTDSSSIDSSSGDIPSFREWAEKHLAEEEKERGDDNTTNVPVNGKIHKIRNKNYASLDCGAKLLCMNMEARSAGSLLSTNRDEYIFSPCNSKIWFVVELCEAVQLKKIELANFELFSSSPRDFSILISDRFPSRDWTVVGQFTAEDKKSIQSFNLQPHHFTKYIKVEFHSHYGKEHFCPISLFNVYGTSEFDVLETVDGNEALENDATDNDDDVNEPIMSGFEGKQKKLETSNNLFGSARDAVMNIVKKAAEALVITPHQNEIILNNASSTVSGNRTKFVKSRQCVTPRYMILCRDCKENFFHKLYRHISCYLKDLTYMLQLDLIWKPLVGYNVCQMFGISPFYLRDHAVSLNLRNHVRPNEFYVVHLLPQEMVAALCNLIGISENRMKQNVTLDGTASLNETLRKYNNANVIESPYNSLFSVSSAVSTSKLPTIAEFMTSVSYVHDTDTIVSQIKPTKTLEDSEVPIVVDPSIASNIPNFITAFPEVVDSEQIKISIAEDDVGKEVDHNAEISEDTMSLDTLISELEKTEDSQQNSIQTSTPKPTLQKESVFVRLANRIKALERNMSLSGQYLEELSRRYKKQVEDMQRILLEAADDRQKSTEREAKLSQEIILLHRHISELAEAVSSLTEERESWGYKALMVGEHSLILFLEIVIFIVIVCLCRGIPNVEISKRKFSLEWHRSRTNNDVAQNIAAPKRRQSLDDLNVNKPINQKRRPSEEALKIDGSTHQDLLIYDTHRTSKNGRKRKKRKELLLKSNTNAINLETGEILTKRIELGRSTAPLSRSASASEIDDHSWARVDYNSRADFKENHVNQYNNEYPAYFKTAVSVRNKRLSTQFNGKQTLSPVYDVSTDQDSSVPSTPIKAKKVNGIKKIVKKFF